METKNLPVGVTITVSPTEGTVIGFYSRSIIMKIDPEGNKFWFRDGVLHRDGDMPAVEMVDGSLIYMINGQVHRKDDLPAIIRASGAKEWWKRGRRHRVGKHAVETPLGKFEWWINGKRVKVIDMSKEMDIVGERHVELRVA